MLIIDTMHSTIYQSNIGTNLESSIKSVYNCKPLRGLFHEFLYSDSKCTRLHLNLLLIDESLLHALIDTLYDQVWHYRCRC